jgi:cyclohexyl-isocyanide hydratase|nr:DJ-1/PfpI family protein [Kofleriaceae bacterium]
MNIAMLLFPDLTQLDFTGPFEVLRRIPGATVKLVAKTREPVVAEGGLAIVPTATFDDCGTVDLLFVPGGWGQVDAGEDAATLAWLRAAGATAQWVTSVCTGSLLLGAAGLLDGYRATTHWAFVDLLPQVGAIPDKGRVVRDRNRITAGGVTAGIDFGFHLVAEIAGERAAQAIQLGLEYDPAPPFRCGHPDVAPAELVTETRQRMQARFDERRRRLPKR